MLIAGEASGDMLAAELVAALRTKVLQTESAPTHDSQPLRTALAPRFFGAGGPCMAKAGVELAFDLTQHSVVGISGVVKNYLKFRGFFHQLLKLAIERQPDAIIGVDYGTFNLHFGHAIRQYVRRHSGIFHGWNPKLIQFVSPQVWASREGRAYQIARDYDLLLSIFPFEKDWYARRVPTLRVEFVGHPLVERYRIADTPELHSREAIEEEGGQFTIRTTENMSIALRQSQILLLPGSRTEELRRHLPVLLGAVKLIQEKIPMSRVKMVLPGEALVELARSLGVPKTVTIQSGDLPQALAEADLAIASTGTVTMECACFGVPAVTLYKTSWPNYELAKLLATVDSATMPNLLANEEVFPEFIQHAATPENIARAALELLQNDSRRARIKTQLAKIITSLGGPGANRRAAEAITSLLP
jgi:lipid-A-disaccharide synthase